MMGVNHFSAFVGQAQGQLCGIIYWQILNIPLQLERFMEAPVDKIENSPSDAEATVRPAGDIEAMWLAWRVRAL
jgi:hypothetical protein